MIRSPGRSIFLVLVTAFAFGLAFAGLALVRAHLQIRAIDPALPEAASLPSTPTGGDGPTSMRVVNTATQGIAHPAYLLEWPDGRRFMIDAGMDREGAMAFGRPMELAFGASPAVPHGDVAEQIGDAVESIVGVAFTHLHLDHTGGLIPVCRAAGREIALIQTRFQADELNYTTQSGADDIAEAGCTRQTVVDTAAPTEVPGFPGLYIFPAGGHTPGSTFFLATLSDHSWLFAGDISNSKPMMLGNEPKPWVYSNLIIPEATERLDRLRRWLARVDAMPDRTVIVAHDLDAALADGVVPWPAE